jgi:sigma-E factor negative regulatory protein RseA
MNDPGFDNPAREQLSALTDGAIARDALRFLLKSVSDDPALARAWTRYQVIGAALRREEQWIVDPGFSERVRMRLAAEDAAANAAAAAPPARAPWLRWAGGGAIAAGVAALALFATRGPMVEDALAPPAAPTLAQEITVPDSELHAPVQTLPAAGGDGASGSGLWDPRVQGYLMQHGQVAGQIGPTGFVPYVYFMATPAQVPPASPDPNAIAAAENDAR